MVRPKTSPYLRAPLLAAALVLAACATTQESTGPAKPPATDAASSSTPPPNWQPTFWDRAMREAQQAREHGDRTTAERSCARGILYVQAQVIKMLYGYADLLDQQRTGAGVPVRSKAQKLEQARDEQAAVRKTGNSTYLGFDPAAELKSFADLLAGAERKSDALLVESLSSAYLYAQNANLRRASLQREGKDPLGEC